MLKLSRISLASLILIPALMTSLPLTSSAASTEIATEIVLNPDKIYVPATALEDAAKHFKFDWNNSTNSSYPTQDIQQLETVIKQAGDARKLDQGDQLILGHLAYQMGTYYSHILHQPDLAIAKLLLAKQLLTEPSQVDWINNQLAYAYSQKFADTKEVSQKNKALLYTQAILAHPYSKNSNRYGDNHKKIAFALYVNGLLCDTAGDYAHAETYLKRALRLYTPGVSRDNQYERMQTRLADILLEQTGHDIEAVALLTEVNQDWQAKPSFDENLYAARNLITLGQANLHTGHLELANQSVSQGIKIYEHVYGINSPLLVMPYHLLIDINTQLGRDQQTSYLSHSATGLQKT